MTTLSPSPVFSDDDPARAAARLNILFRTLALSVPVWGLAGVGLMHEPLGRVVALVGSIEAIVLAGAWLAHAGKTRWASLTLAAGTGLVITALAYTGGGPAAHAAWAYFTVVLIAGLTLGNAAGWLAAVLCALVTLGMALAAQAGALPPSALPNGPLDLWLVSALYLSLAAGIQHLANRFAQESLQQARSELAERQRAEATLSQYAARMETLHRIDRAILAAQSVAETAQAAMHDIRGLLACDRADVFLFSRQSSAIGTLYAVGPDEGQVVAQERRINQGGAYARYVLEPLRQGQPVTIEDMQALDPADPDVAVAQAQGLRSRLHLPLRAGDQWLGALNLARREPGSFGPAERDIAQEVADQLAIAIRQAQLLAATSEALQREQRLNEIARTVSSTLDWQVVVQTIMRLAAEAVGANGSLVGLVADDDSLIFLPSFFGGSGAAEAAPPSAAPVHQTVHRGEGLVWQLIETRQPMLLDEYGAQPGALPYLIQAGVHALLAAPILAGDKALGGLAVFDTDPVKRFSTRDMALLEAIASQAGLAIQNARLFEAERSARVSADALLEAAQAISSTLSLPEVLQRILAQAHKVVPAVTGFLSTEAPDGLNVMALLGYEGREAEVTQALRHQAARTPLMDRLRQRREPLLISDVRAEPDWVTIPQFAHIRSVLVVPIVGREQTIGVLSLESDRAGAFTQQHLEAVRAMASQAAVAMENATLFAATQRQLAELVLLHAGAAAAAEAVDEDALIARATQIIGAGLASSFCGVALVDRERGVVHPHPSHLGLEGGPAGPVEVALGQGVVGGVALSGQPRRIGDVRLERQYVPAMPGMLSELCVPLKAGERIIGVINAESDRPDAFSAADERLLVTFAGLLAAAIVRLRAEAESRALNRQLEQRVAARTRELSALYDVSDIASQMLDLPTLIARGLARVLEAVDSRSGAVFLLAEPGPAASERLLGLTVQQSLDAALVAQLQRMPADGPVAQAALLGRPVLWSEPQAAGLACVGVPMHARSAAVGVLTAFRQASQPFSLEELALLASAADALAISIENVRLRQQAEQTAVAVERERLARDLHDSVTQALYSLTLFAEAGRRLARTPGAEDRLEHYLDRLGETARQALKDMRLLIHNLRPAEFAPADLVGALEQRLDAVERRSGVEASLTVEGAPALSPAAAEALYKIAQEALNNALKHAEARSVRIRLYNDDGQVVLEISDDGRGFAPEAVTGGGMGLHNMQTRAQQVEGVFSVRSASGAGTTITVRVPHGGL